MEIYSGDHVTMSQGLGDKLVALANTFCSEISQSPMPTVKAMLAAVGLGPMEFEDVHEEEKDVGDDADSIVLISTIVTWNLVYARYWTALWWRGLV
jgi:hypothetical protein